MVKVWFYRPKNQKNSFLWHQHEINDIYNAYYKIEEMPATEMISGELIENTPRKEIIYSHLVTDIIKRFKLKSVTELMFLLAQHPNNQKMRCEYCKEGFVFDNRSGQTSTCGHKKFCCFNNCNEPVKEYSFCDKHMHCWPRHSVKEINYI